MATPNPFPLNIASKEDSWDKLQLMNLIPANKQYNAEEFNKILQALQYIYENLGGEGALFWGNLQGELSDQDDLVQYIAQQIGQIVIPDQITPNWDNIEGNIESNQQLINYLNNLIGVGLTGSTLINPRYFNVPGTFEYIVQADAAIINGELFNTAINGTTTLVADATHPRFAYLVVNVVNNVLSVGNVLGTPGPNPGIPILDAENQLGVTPILVPANATQPSGVVTVLAYDQNTQVAGGEFNTAASDGTIDLANTEQAESGLVSVKFSNSIVASNLTLTDTESYSGANLSAIRFGLYIANTGNYRFQVLITDVNNVTTSVVNIVNGQYGFNSSNTGVWQTILIPAADFPGIEAMTYDMIQLINIRNNSTFWVDLFQLQEGNDPVPSSLPNYTINLSGTIIQLLKNGLINSSLNLNELPINGGTL